MSNWNKPYPYHYTLDDQHPELGYVWNVVTEYINKLCTVKFNNGCCGHTYVEHPDGMISVETEMWFDVKHLSERAIQLCNYVQPDIVCVTIKVGKFANNVTTIYKYDNLGKYEVKVRFYKSPNPNITSYMHDDAEHQFMTPNIRVGEFTGLFGNLIYPDNPIDETTIVESTTTPFTYRNSLWLRLISWLSTPVEPFIHITLPRQR